jgi:predicted Zn-dependent protease
MMSRYPGTSVGGAFVLRVAQANFELGNDKDAAKLARRALSMSARGDARAEALWVEGVAEHRLRQYESARKALTTLVAENPGNRYTEGARRNLAMLAEDMGDIEGALDQYLALDYRRDVRDDWEELAHDLLYKLRQVARHKSGRSVIALYSATHGLLILVLFRVLTDL